MIKLSGHRLSTKTSALIMGLKAASICLCSLFIFSCVDTGVDEASVSLSLKGSANSEVVSAFGDVSVSLSRADLAFGPLYLCAGANAGDLCDIARLEWLDSAVVSLLSDEEIKVGTLRGSTGSVRSWMYDLGISSQLTRDEPFILSGAEELEGHSLILEGEALIEELIVPFKAEISVQQSDNTEHGIPVIRKSSSERFSYEVTNKPQSLLISFSADRLLREVDFSAYISRETCAGGDATIACDGSIEQTCDGLTERSRRDCSDADQICIPQIGCRDTLEIKEDSAAYRSLRNALLIGERPTFLWSETL